MNENFVLHLSPGVDLLPLDFLLLFGCPLSSILGIVVASLVKADERDSSPSATEGPRTIAIVYLLRRVLIGAALGLVVALYFIGALTPNLNSVGRILAICVLVGYQAPNIWYSQQLVVSRLIEKRIKSLGIVTEPNRTPEN